MLTVRKMMIIKDDEEEWKIMKMIKMKINKECKIMKMIKMKINKGCKIMKMIKMLGILGSTFTP